jgi:elongation factor Ts
MNIPATQVKELRDQTGAGMMECKKALVETEGDLQKAIDLLREQGTIKSAKLSTRDASQGAVFSYVHKGSQIGVLVEINCETDFVARTDDYAELGKNVAMQIAASAPEYVGRDDVPADQVERERGALKAQAAAEGKPEHILDKIIEGRLGKFFEERCLLEQAYIRDDSMKVQDLVTETVGRLKENIVVKRFTRYQIGS